MCTLRPVRVFAFLFCSDAQREERRELEVLYLLDKYGVSDAFYQALSMKCDSLPRASNVKAARSELNKTVKLFSIPTRPVARLRVRGVQSML